MANINSYPEILNISGDDTLIATDIGTPGSPTKKITVDQIADYIVETSPAVSGTGTPKYIPIWGAGGGSIVDSNLRDNSYLGLSRMTLENAEYFSINRNTASYGIRTLSYDIKQDNYTKAQFGFTDIDDGFCFLYNRAGDGWRIGASSNYPELTITTKSGSEGVEIANNLTVGANATITGILNTGIVKVSNRIEASQVRVDSNYSQPGVVLNGYADGSHIKFNNANVTGVVDAYIQTKDGNISIGKTLGNSANNLNIRQSDGFVGIKQKAPLAPLHIKKNGEAIRLESFGDNECSIDFRQGVEKRASITYDKTGDSLILETTKPTGSRSKITFKVANDQGEIPSEIMRLQGVEDWPRSFNQVVIGNPTQSNSKRELYVNGGIEVNEFSYINADLSVTGIVDANEFKLKGLNTAPLTGTADGSIGQIKFTADYIYVCVGYDKWRRVALSDF